MVERRIVALVLPELVVELARRELLGAKLEARPRTPPFVVVVVDAPVAAVPTKSSTSIDAVSLEAHRLGVRAGQTVSEACAFVAGLSVRVVEREEIREALGQVAEVALRFGTTVGISAPDTVWVDVTGVAHLFGGEEALLADLVDALAPLGHVVRGVVAAGPLLAQALARWSPPRRGAQNVRVVPGHASAQAVAELPIVALPIDTDRAAWLVQLGVHTVGDLAKLPRKASAARLGKAAPVALDLAEGRDGTPLVAYEPPSLPVEETTWEEPVDGVEPLRFVLRGVMARLAARLEGRGEAVAAFELDVEHDRSIARLRGVSSSRTLGFELATPLWRSSELERVATARLERLRLSAPSVGLRLRVTAITRAIELQLDLARAAAGLGNQLGRGPETLPVVFAELAGDVGPTRVGVLELPSAHRPEDASRLVPVSPDVLGAKNTAPRRPVLPKGTPTRLLPHPVPFEAPLRKGAAVSVGRRMYTIRRVVFARRLDRVAWWSDEPTSRDYLRVRLEGAGHEVEALVYVDRETGSRFLHGVLD